MSKCNKCGKESDKCVWVQDFVKDFEYPLCRKCYGEWLKKTGMSDGITDENRRDRMLQRKMEKLTKKLGPGPNFGGLITDPIPGRLRALEERMSKIESVVFDPDYVQIVTTCDEME